MTQSSEVSLHSPDPSSFGVADKPATNQVCLGDIAMFQMVETHPLLGNWVQNTE